MSKKNYRQKQKAMDNGSTPLGADIPLETDSEEYMDNPIADNAENPQDASSPLQEPDIVPDCEAGEITNVAPEPDQQAESEVPPEESQESSSPAEEDGPKLQEEDAGGSDQISPESPEDLQEADETPSQAEESSTDGKEPLPIEEPSSGEEEEQEKAPQETEEEETASQPEGEEQEDGPKVHITKWIYIGAFAVVVAICFLAFYMHARREPISVTKQYLSSIQTLDFDTMESLLADDDLTLLASADLGNPIYAEFFKDVNSKMSYAITKTQFRLGSPSAKVNARIHHIDGTQLYEKVLNQFLLDIVSSAFSGETIAQEETQEKLLSLLTQFSKQIPDQYSDTEICYQLEKTEDGWKISSLDDLTVKVMSANFKSIEKEIQSILSGERPANPVATYVDSTMANTLIDLTSSDVIHISNDEYEVMFNSYKFVEDYAGKTCLLYYYYFTNKSSDLSSPMINLDLKVFQNGELLSTAIPNENEPALNQYYADLRQGQTTLVCQAFSLKDDSNLSVQVTDPSGATSSQIIRLQ